MLRRQHHVTFRAQHRADKFPHVGIILPEKNRAVEIASAWFVRASEGRLPKRIRYLPSPYATFVESLLLLR